MNQRKLITVAALTVLALACSETAGSMLEDAGTMLADAGDMLADAGDMMQPDAGAQDVPCRDGTNGTFPISNPGTTEVTVCWSFDSVGDGRTYCHRDTALWFEGTSDGFVFNCAGVVSVTVHN